MRVMYGTRVFGETNTFDVLKYITANSHFYSIAGETNTFDVLKLDPIAQNCFNPIWETNTFDVLKCIHNTSIGHPFGRNQHIWCIEIYVVRDKSGTCPGETNTFDVLK